MIDLASLPERVRRQLRRNGNYRDVFGSPQGKEVLRDLFAFCMVGEPANAPGDPYLTHYNDGMAAVAKRIAKILGQSDEDMIKLSNEVED